MRKKKRKSYEEKGWGWDPSQTAEPVVAGADTSETPGMARRREVQERLGIGSKGGGLLDQEPILPQRVKAKPMERTPTYYVNRGGTLIPVYDEEEDDLYNVSTYKYDKSYYDRYSFGRQGLGGGRQAGGMNDAERDRANRYKDGLSDSYDSWGRGYAEYQKTGIWQGYQAYRPPTLSYRYIEQMANVLAAHYEIDIRPGDAWEVDIANRKLTYNPLSLVSGTKADLLLTLLHEIGHIINTTPNDRLKAGGPFDYSDHVGKALFEIPGIFEDLRNDAIMQENYDGAQEIYDTAQEAPVRALALRLFNIAEAVRQFWIQEEQRFLEEMNATMLSMKQQMVARPQDEAKIKKSIVSVVDDAFRTTSAEDIKDIGARYKEVVQEDDAERRKRSELPNAFDYAGHMLLHAYGYEIKKGDKLAARFEEDIKPYLEATEGSLPGFKAAKTTQEMFDRMNQEVTPKIQELIDRVQLPPTLAEKISAGAKAKMRQNLEQRIATSQETQGAGQQKIRGSAGSGPGNAIPSDWASGDYNSLRDSVKNEIRTLERFLQNIRREESAVKMTRYEKRGKLDSRRLYSFATGSTRLFKRRLPNVDTVRSFAFSVVIDTSGSMSGNRIVHSTRAAIAFAEAFEKVGIPMEIMKFDSRAAIIKDFDVERMDKDQKAKIGGLVQAAGGSTNIDEAFNTTKILKRPERNKIIIVISDGGVGNPAAIKKEYVDKMKLKGVQTYGFALDGDEREIQALCEMGKGFNLQSPTEMIPHFMGLIKKLMHTARREMMSVSN